MAKVITFSRIFPKKHISFGESTFFVEKFYNSIGLVPTIEFLTELNPHLTHQQVVDFYKTERKTHWSFRQWDVSDKC